MSPLPHIHYHKGSFPEEETEQLEDIQYSTALAHEDNEIPRSYFRSVGVVACIAAASLGVVCALWGFALAASVISFISADIRPSGNSSLFSIIWSVSAPVSTLLFGRLSDRFGRRWFVVGGNVIGLVGGIIACRAKSMDTLIGANVLLGLAAGVQSSYILIVGELVPHKWKFVVIVCTAVPNVVPSGFGAYIARALVETATWRWIYYIYIILIVPVIIAQVIFYHPPSFRQLHGQSRTRLSEVKKIDFIGVFLLVSGLYLFLLGVSWGGEPSPWASAKILGLIISGGITLVVFVLYEIFADIPVPIIPMRLFKDFRGFCILNILSALSGAIYTGLSIIWPSQVVSVYGSSSSGWKETAWDTTTVAFGAWGGITLFGPWMTLIQRVRYQVLFFCAMIIAFASALSQCDRQKKSQGIAFSFLVALPVGWFEVGTGLLVQLISDDLDLGIAFAIVSSARSAFGAIATAIFVAILTQKTPGAIEKHLIPAALGSGLPPTSLPALAEAIQAGTPAALEKVPGITPTILLAVSNALSDAFSEAYSYVYYTIIAFAGVAFIVSFFVMDYDALFTGHVSRQIYRRNGEVEIAPEEIVTEETEVGKTEKAVGTE